MSFRDPIIEELYAARSKLLRECQDDLAQLVRRQQQAAIPPGMHVISSEAVMARQRELDAAYEASLTAGR
jgi:hypothetical protein